ncbi:MAG: AAA family ATPase, partial [Gammaproteobacteria bacterium]
LLRSAVLYGPNASGKSNLVAALSCMRRLVVTSATKIQEGEKLNIVPFLLDNEVSNMPTIFEIIFIEDKIRYQYGFSATNTQIMEEWLYAFPKSKGQQWFTRKYNIESNQYEWHYSTHLKGARHIWENATRSNALFLSTAVNLNSEQLRPIYNWFFNKLFLLKSNTRLSLNFTIDALAKDKAKVLQFLQAADLGITNIEVKNRKVYRLALNNELGKDSLKPEEVLVPEIRFYHQCKNNGNPVSFDFNDESQGTQRLFAYAGYALELLEQNRVLVVDELSSSLHPTLMRFLLSLIQNPE